MQSSACSATDRVSVSQPALLLHQGAQAAVQPNMAVGGARSSGADGAARRVPGRSRAAAASAAHHRSQVLHGLKEDRTRCQPMCNLHRRHIKDPGVVPRGHLSFLRPP